jgi:hypothetical protein
VFEKMLGRYGPELWFGDAAELRAAMVRKQKTDTRDALHILDLLPLLVLAIVVVRLIRKRQSAAYINTAIGRLVFVGLFSYLVGKTGNQCSGSRRRGR